MNSGGWFGVYMSTAEAQFQPLQVYYFIPQLVFYSQRDIRKWDEQKKKRKEMYECKWWAQQASSEKYQKKEKKHCQG